ncbi:nucleoside-diphosphate kinase [Nonomuraea jabiensis]|uniref:Nucleoside diphosphate kinase n=1 Tax=Nonomuraea jabiensis TaxID=882448 RepID=A0A7W9G0I4_9ACTN|nr:nucleoside-diphosphate kinase [Nonomuraea jabiensis]MBB5774977.1 nucleoside diphosphate kinase [Nonomuraea jabiensis]
MVDLNRRAMIVVKPDGVVQNVTGELLAWLASRGLAPLAFREVMLTPERRARLYATSRTGGRLDWDLNAILYTLGPVHAVLLEGSYPSRFDSVSDYVSRALKGHFIPCRARPDTLRGALGALNPIFNLVHATDATEDLERETEALFDAPLCHASSLPGPPPTAVRSGRPHRLPMWTTIAEAVEPWIGKADWPADQVGPSAVALRTAREIWDRAAADGGDLLKGVRTGDTGYWRFATRHTSTWATYLAYTTLRYLDLCLEEPDGN